MSADMYLEVKGDVATPNHSEYEIDSDCEKRIVEVHNARREPGHLVVIDEEKPVYFIGGIGFADKCIWELDLHTTGIVGGGKTSARYMVSSDFDAQVTQRVNATCDISSPLVILRRDNCTYYAGDIPEITGEIQEITFKDVLAFIAGNIAWEDLQKCCTILSWNNEKVLLQEERIRELSKSLYVVTADRDRIQVICDAHDRHLQNTRIDLEIAYKQRAERMDEVRDLTAELDVIPKWICGFFKWWRKGDASPFAG